MNEQAIMMNQQQQQQQQLMNMNQNLMSMNQLNPHQQPQQQMVPMNRSYGAWGPMPPQFQNPNPGAVKPLPQPSGFSKPLGPRNNWKCKKVNKPNDKRRMEQQKSLIPGSASGGIGGGVNLINSGVGNSNFNNYDPPNLNDLQRQNRMKTRKFFPKKKFNKNNSMNMMNTGVNNKYFSNTRSAPYAPRNTTSFLIRAKKSGGIASLVSPCPVTPAILPTPTFSPSKEVLVDMVKEEWGVDGYGSMKGLIRLKSPGFEMEDDEGGSSGSDVEEHAEVERRLAHDLSRFEMIYDPTNVVVNGGTDHHNVLENRVDDQDSHIAQLEEENLILKERLFLMERELGNFRRRLRSLERRGNDGDVINEEVMENESENGSDSVAEDAHSMEDNNSEYFGEGSPKGEKVDDNEGFETGTTRENNVVLDLEVKLEDKNEALDESDKNDTVTNTEVKEGQSNTEFIEPIKTESNAVVAEVIEVNNNDQNKVINVESSKSVTIGGDVCMEEVGDAKDNIGLKIYSAN